MTSGSGFFGGSGGCSDAGVEAVDLERGLTSLTEGSLAPLSGAGEGAGGAEAALDLGGEPIEGDDLGEDDERRWYGGGDCLFPVDFGDS